MYLLVGSETDACCTQVLAALAARGHEARLVANPFAAPVRFTWRLDSRHSAGTLAIGDDPPLDADDIEGLLVRAPALIDPRGWTAADLAYTHAELQAALVAWLWSLRCPVVNRYPASVWYRPQAPLLAWHAVLARCGLDVMETLVGNVAAEARAFAERLGGDAVIYAPLTSDARYVVASEDEWAGVAAMQRCMPVCLTAPHGAPHLACVVGERVVWDGAPPRGAARLETRLRRFARRVGLAFVEVDLAPARGALRVVAVEPWPRVERFGAGAQHEIADAVAGLLAPRARKPRTRRVRAHATLATERPT